MIKYYFALIKPGIIIANLFSVLSGFCFASGNCVNYYTLLFVLLATGCIIASGCVFNNIIDMDIDKKMFRTKGRVLPRGLLGLTCVKIYAMLLFCIGCSIFLLQLNFLSFFLCILGFFFYVFVYSLYFKRKSKHAILLGSIAGAIPPVVGYCTIINFIDLKFILLFIIFALWQIPHSYSILILYSRDYQRANIPTFVVLHGVLKTLKLIILSVIALFIFTCLFYILHFINLISFIMLFILHVIWLFLSISYYFFTNYIDLSRLLFLSSIIFIFLFNMSLIICSVSC
ncbi:Protoheme IX farnesyltransferase [Buchnera aphidicola (Pterocallis alni)]|uniref:heme o synthase n=1 Tax=Buchnera aphidicola TaxID=9 RepID=UPI0034641CAF